MSTSTNQPPTSPGRASTTAEALREELLEAYPKKARRKREKQIVVNDKQRRRAGTPAASGHRGQHAARCRASSPSEAAAMPAARA